VSDQPRLLIGAVVILARSCNVLPRLRFVVFLTAMFVIALPVHAATLLEIYQQAAQSDPQILAAAAAHRAALEAGPQSRAALLPQVSATGNASRNRDEIANASAGFLRNGVYDFNSHGYALNLTQAVYHHELGMRLRQANTRIAQADAVYGAAEQELIVRTASAYFNALAAHDDQTFAHAERDALAGQLEQSKQRFNVGVIAITDVQEAQARYDLAAAQAISADNQRASQDEALRELTGSAPETLHGLGATLPLVMPKPDDMEQWVKTALTQNLQLSAAENALKVAQEEIGRRRAAHLPSLDLIGSHGFQSYGGGPFGGRDETLTTVMLQLNVPLFSGGLANSRTREAVALQEQSREQVEQLHRATERQTRDAFRGISASISTVTALKQATTSNQTALEAATAGNEVGTRTLVDVFNAQSNLYRAKRDYARARYDYLLNTLRLKQAAGTLSPDDLTQLNGFLTAAGSGESSPH